MEANGRDRCDTFWSYVDRSGGADACWGWRTDRKLATARPNYRGQNAARVAILRCGFEIPPGGLVCHRCDNPGCVNPGHLYVGTYSSNSLDSWRAGHKPPSTSPSATVDGEGDDFEVAQLLGAARKALPECCAFGCAYCGGTGFLGFAKLDPDAYGSRSEFAIHVARKAQP